MYRYFVIVFFGGLELRVEEGSLVFDEDTHTHANAYTHTHESEQSLNICQLEHVLAAVLNAPPPSSPCAKITPSQPIPPRGEGVRRTRGLRVELSHMKLGAEVDSRGVHGMWGVERLTVTSPF